MYSSRVYRLFLCLQKINTIFWIQKKLLYLNKNVKFQALAVLLFFPKPDQNRELQPI